MLLYSVRDGLQVTADADSPCTHSIARVRGDYFDAAYWLLKLDSQISMLLVAWRLRHSTSEGTNL